MTDSARVETLTASVRTLVVGNRQITMSVAKQLDQVDLVDLSLMGRVRMSDGVRAIGAGPDGSLALADIRGPGRWNGGHLAVLKDDDLSDFQDGDIVVCSTSLDRNGCIRLSLGDRPRLSFTAWVDGSVVVECGVPGHRRFSSQECSGWSMTRPDVAGLILAELQRQRAEHDRREAAYEAADAADLIVLAGLR